MSIRNTIAVKCPACGQNSIVPVWRSINAQFDLERKKQLLDGTLFQHICPRCGDTIRLDYECRYHDMNHRAVVHYVRSEKSARNIFKAASDFRLDTESAGADTGKSKPHYRERVVKSQNALREKAIIFNQGLDDRIVEVMKAIVIQQRYASCYDLDGCEVLFAVDQNGDPRLEFYTDNPFAVYVDKGLYPELESCLSGILSKETGEPYEIGLSWAQRLISAN